MVLGELQLGDGGAGVDELLWRVDEEERGGKGGWGRRCLGTFYVKPNYPGRSSHICNGGFIVTDAARNRGVGRLMGEGYLEWAPKLVSVFNFVSSHSVQIPRLEREKKVEVTINFSHFQAFSNYFLCFPPLPCSIFITAPQCLSHLNF